MTEQEDNTSLTSTSSQMEEAEKDAGLFPVDSQVFSQKFNQAESWLANESENESNNTDESNEEVDDFFDDFDPLEAIKTTPEVSLPETEKQTTKTVQPPSASTAMLALSSRQTLENINELFLRLQEDLAETETIELDASAVTHIDAATLQLFVALQQTAAREQKTLIINFPSEAFIEAAQLLGMEKILELDQAAAGFFNGNFMTPISHNEREFEYTWQDFETLRRLSSQYSGIVVGDEKFEMFYSRLTRRLRSLGLTDFSEYCYFIQQHHDLEFAEFINAITTNLTAFFRERHHFDYLKTTLIPELLKTKRHERKIRVWSAGCSSGEEAYSLAITLLDNTPADWDVRILATDIDTRVLKSAISGEYYNDKCAGLSTEILQRWFKKGVGKNKGKIKVKPALKRSVDFKVLNLVDDWPELGKFDFIFCRNVLIYFDRATKEKLLQRFSTVLPVGSKLFIGHSESMLQMDVSFKSLGNTIYQRLDSASK